MYGTFNVRNSIFENYANSIIYNYRKIIEAHRAWVYETIKEFTRLLLLSRKFQEELFRTMEDVGLREKLLLRVKGIESLQEIPTAKGLMLKAC